MKVWAAGNEAELASLAAIVTPKIVVTDLDMDNDAGPALIGILRERLPSADIAVTTNFPYVVRIAQAIRRGASTVLACPFSLCQLLSALHASQYNPQEHAHMSLDRAIWEYLSQTVMAAGSLSEAARRLRLDRSSLRRMLRKTPSTL